MGKSSGSSQPTQQTVTQSSIPEQFYPYLSSILDQGESLANKPYQAYQGQQLAPLSQDTNSAFDATRQNVGNYAPMTNAAQGSIQNGMQTAGMGTGLVGAGTNVVGQGIGDIQNALGQFGQAQSQVQGGSNAIGMGIGQAAQGTGYLNQAGQLAGSTQNFGQAQANQYMSPYTNDVINSALQRNQDTFNQQQIGRNDQAISNGVFGGSRSAVADAIAQKSFNQLQSDTTSNLLNQGYSNAQSQFNTDQSRQLSAAQALGNVGSQQGQLGSTIGSLGSQLGQLGSTYGSLATQQGQLGNSIVGAGSTLGSLGSTLGSLGQAQGQLGATASSVGGQVQQYGMNDANALRGIGSIQEQQQQAADNIGVDNFNNQQNYGQNQLGWLSSILHGYASTPNTTTSTYQPTNGLSQITGAATGLAGLVQSLGAKSS